MRLLLLLVIISCGTTRPAKSPYPPQPIEWQHEEIHVAQQKKDGWKFYWRYLFSSACRVQYEAEAYAVQARAGCPIDGPNGLAACLSGPLYGHPCTEAEAAAAIRKFL